MSSQTVVHFLLELGCIFDDHLVGLLHSEADGVVPSAVRIVKGGLIRAQLHNVLFLLRQSLPELYDIAEVSNRDGLASLLGLLDASHNFLEICDLLLDPTLLEALVEC